MIHEVESLMDRYIKWLKDRTALRQVGDWVEITTPYLDRHNDCLQVYARKENSGFLLSDDGYTIGDLRLSGCELDTKKRKDLLRITLNGFGVTLDGDVLVTRATQENFPQKKHNLVQAMLAVDDLFYLAVPIVASLFLEDVTTWLELHEIRYVQSVTFVGKTGYEHRFDFAIPKSRKYPERLVRAINRPNRDNAESLILAWSDTRETRPPDSRAYAFLNDTESSTSLQVLEALRNYDVRATLWSNREQVREELAN